MISLTTQTNRNKSVFNFILFTALTLLGSPLVMAQQAKSKSKPVRQVTENTLPAPKTEQYTPPVKGVGIVIKKNPGSGASKISGTTNAQGETTVTITEKGNYVVTVMQPLKTVTNKSAGENDGIQGVRIGLGKNPSPCCVMDKSCCPKKIANDKGEVEFTELEPGSYNVKIESATEKCPPGFVLINGSCEPSQNTTNPKIDEIRAYTEATPIKGQIKPLGGETTTGQSCCTQGAWDELNYYNSKNELKPLGSCGSDFGNFACGETMKFKTCFLCAETCADMSGKMTYQLFNANTNTAVSEKITANNCSTTQIKAPTPAGKYYVQFMPSCGTTNCEPCHYYFTTTSNTIQECCIGGKWIPPFLPAPAPTAANPLNYVISNPATGSICGKELQQVKCNSYLNFRYAYQCNTSTKCKATITYILRNETTKAIINTFPGIENSKNFALLTPAVSGRYSVEAIVSCGDATCDSCTVYFTLNCGN